ncbi:hypothetical protein STEG23_036099 [Scotinomys teguina]
MTLKARAEYPAYLYQSKKDFDITATIVAAIAVCATASGIAKVMHSPVSPFPGISPVCSVFECVFSSKYSICTKPISAPLSVATCSVAYR